MPAAALTEERIDLLRRCRVALVDDAEIHQSKYSHDGWIERALESPAGEIVGLREIEAIASLFFGRRRFRKR
jgi:hypothetical protein